jgi:hypothetical protein
MKLTHIVTATALVMVLAALAAGSCDPAADVAARNISTAADNFEVPRRISVVNGITDNVSMVMEGYCSLGNNDKPGRLSITCKTGRNQYIRNFLDKSDNVYVLTEQLEAVNASEFHYRTVFRPQALIPDIDFQGSMNELINNQNTDG